MKKKTIWFVYPYGPLPTEKTLECRYARFGRILSEQGYNCVWWTANFNHGTKARRADGLKTLTITENFTIVLVPTTSYQKNISFGRVKFEIAFSKNLKNLIEKENKPDLIITPGTGLFTAFRPIWPYMQNNNVPVIYDIMDVHMISSYMREHHRLLAPFTDLILNINKKREKRFYENVSGVSALGKNQLEIALKRIGKANIPSCLVYNGIYLDKFKEQLCKEPLLESVQKPEGWIWCVYAGSLGPSYDIQTVLEAAQIAKKENEKIAFIIAGSGSQAEKVSLVAAQNDRIKYVGILKPEELAPLYKQCDIGLCTYADYSTVDMPDKFYDYCAAGLALVNSLKGEVNEHIENHSIGVNYKPGDPLSLYFAIKSICDSELDSMKERAKMVAEQFDIKKLVNSLTAMIDSITRGDTKE